MREYQKIVKFVLQHGTRKESRTGVDMLSAFNVNYQVDLANGFPLLTTKKISWKNIVVENLWFLSGKPHIGLLRQHGCKFWEPWANKAGNVPTAYGDQWRNFPDSRLVVGRYTSFDQIQWVLGELKDNPNSRRLVVSAWYPPHATQSSLPPCHLLWILNVTSDGRLNLHLTQRSCDIGLGLPYDLAGYAFLLSLFARFVGRQPGVFAHTLVDAHIYTCKSDSSGAEYDHVDALCEQVARDSRPLPKLHIAPWINSFEDLEPLWGPGVKTEDLLRVFQLSDYNPHPAVKLKPAV